MNCAPEDPLRDAVFVPLRAVVGQGNLSHEAMIRAVRAGRHGFIALWRLVRGGNDRAVEHLAELFPVDPSSIPWREGVVEAAARARGAGNSVLLVSSRAEAPWARQLVAATAAFDGVVVGRVDQQVASGDASPLVPELSDEAASARTKVFATANSALRALRLRQWSKNALVFAPVVLAHQLDDAAKLLAAFVAFIAFGLCASSVYVVNDVFDAEVDRHHPTKRSRPFAAGDLSLAVGAALSAMLLIGGVGLICTLCSPALVGVLLLYVTAATLYSVWFKRLVLLDVMVLSQLYVVRLVAGGIATDVVLSKWLLCFAMFWFVSLAFAKRYSELSRLSDESGSGTLGRGYRVTDLSLIESIGPAQGYLAVLVFGLYIQSEQRGQLYQESWSLWLIVPLLTYWISWIWIKAKRREMTEDPVLFALRDRVSLAIGAVVLILACAARPI